MRAPVVPDPARPGQESVWDYPRPPRVERSTRDITVALPASAGGAVIARTTRAWRVLETSHPPGWYVPRADVVPGALRRASGASVCEYKGPASYWDVLEPADPDRAVVVAGAAWSYEAPWAGYEQLAGAIACYPTVLDCRVDGERARPQPGGFYGGWVTDEVAGPVKGGPGTAGW